MVLRSPSVLIAVLLATVSSVPALAGQRNGKGSKPAVQSGGRAIVDTYSLFRCHFEQNGLFVKKNDGSWWPREPKGGKAPPENWFSPEFDASDWPVMPGPFFPIGQYFRYGFNFRTGVPSSMSTVCLRTGFEVTDPAKAGELKLDMEFLGGAAVYVNGKEIGRSHLPEGEIKPLTLAEVYPKEAYVRLDGKTIIRSGWQDPEKNRANIEKRVRRVSGMVIPGKLLRKGRNVLAIRIQSGAHNQISLVKGRKGYRFYAFRNASQAHGHWVAIGMPSIRLTATGNGVRPALTRPKGLQVFNHSPFKVVYDIEYRPPDAEVAPVRISAARNGSFSGLVVLSGDGPISGLKAEVGELKLKDGKGALPASAVRLRYPQPTLKDPAGYVYVPGGNPRGTSVSVYDALYPNAPATVPVRRKNIRTNRPYVFSAVQPVWITADVPADAAPGTYSGKLKLAAKGSEAVEVPLEVRVSAWEVPDPKQWRTFSDFFQSPESVAMAYKVPMWSEEHWKLIEKSLEILGGVGNNTCYLRLVAKTANGNSQTILRWTKEADGSLKPDFTLIDRYLGLIRKHQGKPLVLCLYVWDRHLGGGYFGRSAQKWDPIEVTLYDPKTGKSSLTKTVPYNEFGKVKAFWKPAVAGINERVKKLGWEKSLMLGIGDDWIPDKQVVKLWKELMPSTPWVSMSHAIFGSFNKMQPVGYATTVWNPKWMKSPSQRLYGWNSKSLIAHFDRDSWRQTAQDQLFKCAYTAAERNICGAQRGFGRMNGDFFKVIKGKGARVQKGQGLICGRYWCHKAQLTLRMNPYVWPGPREPVSTVRLSMIRENMMECEARIAIESALLDKSKRARLGAEKAAKLEKLLVERTSAIANCGLFGGYKFMASDWRGLRARVFDAAAEVEKLK